MGILLPHIKEFSVGDKVFNRYFGRVGIIRAVTFDEKRNEYLYKDEHNEWLTNSRYKPLSDFEYEILFKEELDENGVRLTGIDYAKKQLESALQKK